MSLNQITFPTTNLSSSKVTVSDGVNNATLEPTLLTVANASISGNINGAPYVAPVNYIDADGNSSGNVHMSTNSLDWVNARSSGFVINPTTLIGTGWNTDQMQIQTKSQQNPINAPTPGITLKASIVADAALTYGYNSCIYNDGNGLTKSFRSGFIGNDDPYIEAKQKINDVTSYIPITVNSSLNIVTGSETASLTSTDLIINNVNLTNINGSPYVPGGAGYIDADGVSSGDIHMTSHTLDFVDGNYTASFSAGDLSVDNVNLSKINDVPFVPAVNYIDSSGLASGSVYMKNNEINFINANNSHTDVLTSGINSTGLNSDTMQFYASSRVAPVSGTPPGISVDALVVANSLYETAGLSSNYINIDSSYNNINVGFKNSSTPTIEATYHPSNSDPVQPLAIDFKSPLNLVGADASNVQLSSVAGNLSLDKLATPPVGDYTIQGYLPINLSGSVYYLPLFQPTLSGGSSGPIGIHPGVPQIP